MFGLEQNAEFRSRPFFSFRRLRRFPTRASCRPDKIARLNDLGVRIYARFSLLLWQKIGDRASELTSHQITLFGYAKPNASLAR
jgi:hypothetical protein